MTDRNPATGQRSAGELFKEITEDLSTLVRKEIELARIELMDSVMAKLKGAVIFAVVGVMGLFMLLFGLVAIRDVVDHVAPSWGDRWLGDVCVVVLLGLMAAVAALVGKRKLTTPISADLTKETLKDDVDWAKSVAKR